MQGPIAQIVALTIAGNAALQGKPVSGFWPNCSVFRHNERVDFVTLAKNGDALSERAYAADPSEWFEKLAGQAIAGLALHYTSERSEDRKLVGMIGGGGRWLMEARTGGAGSDFWDGRWAFDERSASGSGKWITRYGRIAENRDCIEIEARPIEQLRNDLDTQLSEIAVFADNEVDQYWGDWFRRGRSALHNSDPLRGNFHEDIDWTHSLPLDYLQALGTVINGWAFGGMGSWNDTGPKHSEKQDEYERRSEQLFATMIEVAVAVANFGISNAPKNPIGFRPRSSN